MNQLIRSEWIKLRTIPLHIVLWSIAVGFVLVITVLVGIFNGSPEFFESRDLFDLIGGTSVVAALLVSVVSALAITSEFAHSTIRPTLAATPSRTKIFLAKAIVLAAVGGVLGIVTVVSSGVIGALIFNVRGADIGVSGDDGTLAMILGTPVFFVILAMFGYGLGLLTRNSPAAVSIAILWPLLVETVLGGVLAVAGVDEPTRFLPYQSAFALVITDSNELPNGRLGGGLFFGLVVAALVAGAIAINNRRDV